MKETLFLKHLVLVRHLLTITFSLSFCEFTAIAQNISFDESYVAHQWMNISYSKLSQESLYGITQTSRNSDIEGYANGSYPAVGEIHFFSLDGIDHCLFQLGEKKLVFKIHEIKEVYDNPNIETLDIINIYKKGINDSDEPSIIFHLYCTYIRGRGSIHIFPLSIRLFQEGEDQGIEFNLFSKKQMQ